MATISGVLYVLDLRVSLRVPRSDDDLKTGLNESSCQSSAEIPAAQNRDSLPAKKPPVTLTLTSSGPLFLDDDLEDVLGDVAAAVAADAAARVRDVGHSGHFGLIPVVVVMPFVVDDVFWAENVVVLRGDVDHGLEGHVALFGPETPVGLPPAGHDVEVEVDLDSPPHSLFY